jgi:hypothetical protein
MMEVLLQFLLLQHMQNLHPLHQLLLLLIPSLWLNVIKPADQVL